MSSKEVQANQYEKEQAVYNIRCYYNLRPDVITRNTLEKAFAFAKAEYVGVLKRQLEIAESISITDAFPKSLLSELEKTRS
jgi:hypothetical protein